MNPQRRQEPHSPAVYTRRRILVAGAALFVPATIARRALSDDSSVATSSSSSAASPPLTTANVNALTANAASDQSLTGITPAATAPARITVGLDHDLNLGMTDQKVAMLQRRLTELGFDPGEPDGVFGDATIRAVWAFEKLVLGTKRQDTTGTVTPETWDVMTAGIEVRPLRPGQHETHVEVYLPEQVAVLFDADRAALITHVSTGEGVEWCDEVLIDNDDGTQTTKGICGKSITPGGVFHFERKVDGWRNAALGRLYKPVYFNYGLAIHGSSNVPDRPASHGCVRIPMHIAEYFPDRVSIGDTVYIFDGRKQPEVYGAQPPIFDWADPDATTTTSSSTTNPSSTTSSPATTTSTPS